MDPWRGRQVSFGGLSGGPPPRDIVVLLVVVFATFSLQFFAATASLILWLRLTPLVWQLGTVWQLVTYPFIGDRGAGFWILLILLMLWWFGRDVYGRLGRVGFWWWLAQAAVGGAVAAVLVDLVATLVFGGPLGVPFAVMQGSHMLLALLVAAFALLYRNATLLLFFVLPVQARYLVHLELLIAFIAFLMTKDLAGFVGLCTGIGITWAVLTRGSLRRGLREARLRALQRWYRLRLDRQRRRSGLHVVRDDEPPTYH